MESSREGAITIRRETPRQADVARLIEALDAYASQLYPPESNHLLDVEALCAPSIRFLVARLDGEALGCGALRVDPAGYGEVKRMCVLPRARGRKVGLYRSFGFRERGPFGDYQPDPLSVFMAKDLLTASSGGCPRRARRSRAGW